MDFVLGGRGQLLMLAVSLVALILCSGPCLGAWELKEAIHRATFLEPNAHLQALGQISDAQGSLARTFFSPAHKRAADQLSRWMEEAGMETWIDVVGNVHGRINGSDPSAAATVIGSHYDTVLDAGKYDGSLGIITGISAVKTLLITQLDATGKGLSQLSVSAGGDLVVPASAASGLLRAPVHIVGFTDEEGVRFQSTFLGSRALAGSLQRYGMLNAKDKDGTSLRELLSLPSDGDALEEALKKLSLPPESVREYIELHMEQGPVLERKDLPLGVVSAIAGQTRLWLSIDGTQGHAGTVPMKGRGDSLAAAAEAILFIENRCGGGPDAQPTSEFTDADMLVCTVGEVRVWPGASNVIAGNVQLSIDIRSKGDDLRNKVVDDVMADIKHMCETRGVECGIKRNHDAAAVLCDEEIMKEMVSAVAESRKLLDLCGPSCQPPSGCQSADAASPGSCKAASDEIPIIVSGAGHDAMAMAEMTKMGMMFVRCRGGVSHSPLEHVEEGDVASASAALTMYLRKRLAQEMAP